MAPLQALGERFGVFFSWEMGLKEMSGHIEMSGDFLKDFFEPHFWGVWSLPASACPSIAVHIPSGRDLEGDEEEGQRNQTALGRGTENRRCPF